MESRTRHLLKRKLALMKQLEPKPLAEPLVQPRVQPPQVVQRVEQPELEESQLPVEQLEALPVQVGLQRLGPQVSLPELQE
jgi:hypothetical protein